MPGLFMPADTNEGDMNYDGNDYSSAACDRSGDDGRADRNAE